MSLSGLFESHGVTWSHVESHGVTWSHFQLRATSGGTDLFVHKYVSIILYGVTWSHMESHGVTWSHVMESYGVTLKAYPAMESHGVTLRV